MKALADSFWNIRGRYRVAGVLDIGTHMSVVRRDDGRFVVIDGCGLGDAERDALLALTGNGERVAAVVHVHPFHTMHVEATQRLCPSATLYGTAAVYYWVICLVLSFGQARIEHRLERYVAR